jgi:hypothetical protein
VIIVQGTVPEEKISLEPLILNGPFFGTPAVYDSLMIFWNRKLPNAFFSIFNLNTGEYIGDFCSKGGGQEEFYTLPIIYNLYIDNREIKTMLLAPHENKMMIWNISKSVELTSTVYDTIVSYERSNEQARNYIYTFRQDEDMLVTRVSSELLSLNGEIASTPFYEKRTIYSNQLLKRYDIYKSNEIRGKDPKKDPSSYYYSWDIMKPDGSKIAQAMYNLSQINIIDLATGEVTGYRLEGTPDYSCFNTDMTQIKTFYMRIQADDNYIYALYYGEAIDETSQVPPKLPHIIHVFNWKGKFVKKLSLDHEVLEIAIDLHHNKLYAIDVMNDLAFSYDLNQIQFE